MARRNAATAGRLTPCGRRGLSTMLDTARRLLIAPSARSDVPPFMVMDVMAAAARIEAAGGRVIHMEVGQPAAPAPATAIAAAQAALDVGRIAYTEMLGIPTLRARIARHYQETLRRRDRPDARGRDDRLVGRVHSGVPRRCSTRATVSRSRCRAIRPTATFSRRSAASRCRSRPRRRRAGRSRRRCCWRRTARSRCRAC